MDYTLLLDRTLQLGHDLLVNGAEISRVDDTLERIYKTYDVTEYNIFTITCSIVITIKTKDGQILTQSKRIYNSSTNLDRVERLNALSRYICKNKPSIEYITTRLERIQKRPEYPMEIMCLAFGLVACSLALYFGGTFLDAFVAGAIGIALKIAVFMISKVDNNAPVINVIASFFAGILAVFAVKIGFGDNLDTIIISNMMLLIPGVAITNALRDMIKGDVMSGMNRFIEAITIAVSVSFGFVLSTYVGGKII